MCLKALTSFLIHKKNQKYFRKKFLDSESAAQYILLDI